MGLLDHRCTAVEAQDDSPSTAGQPKEMPLPKYRVPKNQIEMMSDCSDAVARAQVCVWVYVCVCVSVCVRE